MSPVSAADERDSSEVLLEDAVKRQGFQGVGLEANVGAEAEPLAHCGGCMGQTWVLGLGGLAEEQDKAGKKEKRRWDENGNHQATKRQDAQPGQAVPQVPQQA